MKNIAAVFTAFLFALTLSACSSNYVMHTNDGRTIVTSGKPKVDKETGMIGYSDANGTEQQINRSDVKEMMKAQ